MPLHPEIVVRDAGVDDSDAIRELTLAAYGQYSDRMAASAWAALLSAVHAALSTDIHAQRIVAEQDGSILGSVLLFPQSEDAYPGLPAHAQRPEIRLLAVAPEARGLGIARRLVDECIRRAKVSGAEAIGLHTSISMREAIQLYKTLGFRRDAANDIVLDGAELVESYQLDLKD